MMATPTMSALTADSNGLQFNSILEHAGKEGTQVWSHILSAVVTLLSTAVVTHL